MTDRRHIVGVMTGTSLDGIDAALVQVDGHGLEMNASLARHQAGPLGPARESLQRLASGEPLTAATYAQAGRELGEACAEVAATAANNTSPDLVAVHGQTVHHAPPDSLQILNPAPIARRLRCPVFFDLRAADLAAGGQGAPITPLADWVLFRSEVPTTVINLGGFCNLTHLPAVGSPDATPSSIRAEDVCPCNHVLDTAARELLDRPFDAEGEVASRGQADDRIAATIATQLRPESAQGRSLGTGDEGRAVVDAIRSMSRPEDALATLVSGIATAILDRVPHDTRKIILAGGGARNATLFRAMEHLRPGTVCSTDLFGIHVQAREAVAMGVLGALALDGVPLTLPYVTGRPTDSVFDGSWCLPRRLSDQSVES
ncbi:MAG: anhydro-N-acetylmuramic acid kinase [Phycisphaerales bacterium]|nr:anhydro-N-acetylmuramic acid kinase [Phycisphaerales bacterium]